MANAPFQVLLRSSLLLGGLLCAVGCFGDVHAAADTSPVIVLGAASTKDALQAMADEASRTSATPLRIEISAGPSHALAQQILSGAPGSIYVSANRRWAEEVDQASLSAESIEWLSNQLVLIVPAESQLGILSLADLPSNKVKRIAIAGENVPAGIYAQQALTHHQLFATLQESGKLVRGHDVRSTLAYAERGEVDAAIVYATDARLTDHVRVVARLDPASHDPIVYPLVRLKAGSEHPAAEAFFAFLQSEKAQQIARDFGFVPLGLPTKEAN